MKFLDNKEKMITSGLLIMYLIGLLVGNTFNIVFLSVIGNISIVLAICVTLFDIKKIRVPVVIYGITFLIEQALGYGLNIKLLKYYISINNNHGMEIGIASVVFPIVISIIISIAYRITTKETTVK